jgi:hypothetical protein
VPEVLGLSKPKKRGALKTRMNDQSWKQKEDKEPCPGSDSENHRDRARDPWSPRLNCHLLYSSYIKDKGKRIKDETGQQFIRMSRI